MASVGIIGGGIAGLTAAYQLHRQGHDVTLFEQSTRAGGAIHSERAEGYLVEHGPNTIQRSTPLLDALIRALGLEAVCISARPAASKRYVVLGRTPVALPTSLPAFLGTELFSPRAKLRLLAEPFIRRAAPDEEENVAAFARRRLGRELLDYGLNPFVAGVFAGSPEQLSLPHAFPRLHALEQQHGSLLVGQLRRALQRRGGEQPRRRMFSFRDGLQALPDALAAALGDAVQCDAAVTAIRPGTGSWSVVVRRDASSSTHRFDALLYAAPLHSLQEIDFDTELDLAPLLGVPYPPVSLVALGLERGQVRHPLDGFGLLVPEVESHLHILGTLFSSTIFPGRAPAGHVLLTTFVGGTRHPSRARADDAALQELVCRDLGRLLGLHGRPSFVRIVRWEHAIPQYHLGYGRVKTCIERLEARHPGFFMAGNYRRGISVGDAAASGAEAVRRLAEHLR